MKTINSQIDLFENFERALRAFNKSTVPCHLLEAKVGKMVLWYIDRSKEAQKCWPNSYKLIAEK